MNTCLYLILYAAHCSYNDYKDLPSILSVAEGLVSKLPEN